jgi:hypothetical protein
VSLNPPHQPASCCAGFAVSLLRAGQGEECDDEEQNKEEDKEEDERRKVTTEKEMTNEITKMTPVTPMKRK